MKDFASNGRLMWYFPLLLELIRGAQPGEGRIRLSPLEHFLKQREIWSRLGRYTHSERKACITSTRAARTAGNTEASMAATSSTNAAPITGPTSGIRISPK